MRKPNQGGHLGAMLRACAGHICLHLDRPPDKIAIAELLELKQGLRAHLQAKGLRKRSVRSYINFLGILVQKAKDLGWAESSPEVEKAWQEIAEGARTLNGLRGVIRWAIHKGKRPLDFAEGDLNAWVESALREGRTIARVLLVKRTFRKFIFDAGFSSHFPHLLPPVADRTYRIPLREFPESLRSQVIALLRWKTATFAPGRPTRAKHRPVTADHFRSLMCRIFGFLVGIKGEAVDDLRDLFSRQSVTAYVEWAVNTRHMKRCTLAPDLGTIGSLASYPPLASMDFGWIPNLVSQLPGDSEIEPKERKARKWVPYDVLARIPEQILRDAESTPGITEKQKAQKVRDALLILWLTTLAWRQRNLRQCRLLPFADGGNLSKESVPAQSAMAVPQWVLFG